MSLGYLSLSFILNYLFFLTLPDVQTNLMIRKNWPHAAMLKGPVFYHTVEIWESDEGNTRGDKINLKTKMEIRRGMAAGRTLILKMDFSLLSS